MILMFADDTKISQKVSKVEDSFLLQQDLDCLMEWSKYWHPDFNIDKCKIMRIQQCCHNEFKLQEVTEEKDLGIIVTNDLKPFVQYSKTAATAMQVHGIIKDHFPILHRVCNGLPLAVRQSPSVDSFKRNLKTYYFASQ